ncbi:uncharacterized protein BDZ99DRAFT_458436 [Mytilinidion resinicola]|uniref:Uncharacterized protein n=1 Tax=Mytilinidion resinicola TaxID=574789 RepID=A0A6A6Z654_9PEZI|nr:uncharacterized protein BDZ99DRAFT_458436 [Mytilinidion resinicola]KAF2816582.1 hypothetical protein BDZ99DRAFT_458436 [Mytilinidion resinicola]
MASTLQSGPTAPSETPNTHELSFPLPRAPQSHIHLHLTNHTTSLLLFLTSSGESASTLSSLGSFVYAMPNRTGGQPLSTPLYTQGSTLDFATRLARVLAKKVGKPVYVGNSVSFAGAGMGGTVEEEMEGFRRCVEVVVGVLEREKDVKE